MAQLYDPPPKANIFDRNCPARNILGHVTGRWGGLVIISLLERTLRYSELRARIDGVSEKMLAQTLRELQLDGLIVRRSFPVVPPRTEYELTASGREVAVLVRSLITWIEGHTHEVHATRMAAHECTAGHTSG